MTILKPICGAEPWLEEALASFCAQHYPAFQLVIGAQCPDDPALVVARRVRERFPQRDIAIVVDATPHGCNRKVANLINMLPAARHDVLVIADSDLHVRPDYLDRVVAALAEPGIGLVTTLACGEPAAPGLPALLGAQHITHTFLPGALLARALGRQDCLGGTMALRRQTLEQVGGLPALVQHLADDHVLGGLVRGLGLGVRLAETCPVVTVQERTLGALWLHELRWARTIGAWAPLAYAASVLQFPLAWALLAVLLTRGAAYETALFLAAWAVRAGVARGIDQALAGRRARAAAPLPWWLLPLRDVLTVAEVAVSFCGKQVVWRGHRMQSDERAKLMTGGLGGPARPTQPSLPAGVPNL